MSLKVIDILFKTIDVSIKLHINTYLHVQTNQKHTELNNHRLVMK